MASRPRRLLAELLGTLLLAAVVVGSGIAAQNLSPGQVGLELAENAVATSLGLGVIILVLAPISGAHLNPVISLVDSLLGRRSWIDAVTYIPTQIVGCIAGSILANAMFGHAAIGISTTDRSSTGHFIGEIVATAGLVLIVFLLARQGLERFAPIAVGAYIGAAYFFTSSTSFANPAITIGRIFTDSFAGIAANCVPGFVSAQLIGGAIGYVLVRLLTTTPPTATTEGSGT
ncbi:MAG TPA: aquaporin [Galbitalea sp.]|jgi:arsenate reductase|nr:aquaporin [Galbitalea sp.]